MTNATVDLMKVHCSVRAYEDKTVSEDVRKAILEAAFAASSSSFLQLVTVIRVTDAAKRQAFYELSGNQKHVLTAPEFWVFCADMHRNAELVAGADLGWTEQLILGCVDTGIVAQSAMTALESFGLGGVFVGGIRNGIARADDVLALPQNVFPVVGLAFGYPAEKNELKPRLPLEVTVMENSYREPDPVVMAAYDAVSRAYYKNRTAGSKDVSWAETLPAILGKERRPFVLEFLRKKGWAQR